MPDQVSAEFLRDLIRAKIRRTSLKAVALELDMAPEALRALLHQSREPGSRVSQLLGYRRMPVVYERIEPAPEAP